MDIESTRRKFLLTSGCTLLAGSGCVDQVPIFGDTGFRLGEIHIVNGRPEETSIHVQLAQNGTNYIDEEFTAPPAGEPPAKPSRTWPEEPVEYTLTTEIVGIQQSEYERRLTAEEDEATEERCMVLEIYIHPTLDQLDYMLTPSSEHYLEPEC